MEQDVTRFNISMHNVGFGENLERLKQILEIIDGFRLFKATVLFDLLLERTSVAKFVDEVVVVGSFKYFNEANNMRGVFDLGQGLNFVDGELLQFGAHLELFNFDDFDGY